MSTLSPQFEALAAAHGSDVTFHRVDSLIPCPCRTPEGFRDVDWHFAHPLEPMCNEKGMLPDPAHSVILNIKAFVQPVTSARGAKLPDESILALFGEVQADDHVGFFPESWNGAPLNLREWSRSGEDYIEYDNRRFVVVNANLIPDPMDGDPRHHWEAGLRLVTSEVIAVMDVVYPDTDLLPDTDFIPGV